MSSYLAGQYDPAVLQVIFEQFYEELRSNHVLGSYFSDVPKAKRQEMSLSLLDAILGNIETEYVGEIKAIHENMRISREEYQEFCSVFLAISTRNGIDSDTLEAFRQRFHDFEEQILGYSLQ